MDFESHDPRDDGGTHRKDREVQFFLDRFLHL